MSAPRFAAIVRTRGDRPDSLREALLSLALQQHPVTAIVVVHADAAARERVAEACARVAGLAIQVLHAPDAQKLRGYPANVALRYYHGLAPASSDGFFFLDDDDIVYPFFTTVMAQAFLTTEADLVYGGANCVEDGRALESPWPGQALEIFRENFIPINSYAVRAATWRERTVYFDEDYEYLEDWKFLLDLARNRYRFAAAPAFVAEFRIESARRRREAASPRWQRDLAEIRRYINATDFPIPGSQLAAAVSLRRPEPRVPFEIATTAADRKLMALQQRVADLEHSLSWRITSPLRAVGKIFLKRRG